MRVCVSATAEVEKRKEEKKVEEEAEPFSGNEKTFSPLPPPPPFLQRRRRRRAKQGRESLLRRESKEGIEGRGGGGVRKSDLTLRL